MEPECVSVSYPGSSACRSSTRLLSFCSGQHLKNTFVSSQKFNPNNLQAGWTQCGTSSHMEWGGGVPMGGVSHLTGMWVPSAYEKGFTVGADLLLGVVWCSCGTENAELPGNCSPNHTTSPLTNEGSTWWLI